MGTNESLSIDMPIGQWLDGAARTVTLSITEDCNLNCRYCYMVHKTHRRHMPLEVGKRAVDFVISSGFDDPGIVWDFIGGEPLLEIDLMDQLCTYITEQQQKYRPDWTKNHRFLISTNGLLYSSPKVQQFLKRFGKNINIGISLDGNKTKHDLQRVYANGIGSYDDVIKNVELWVSQFSGTSTKATFSHDDLPHLKDSVISIWKQGIKTVAANLIFEDVWKEGDDAIFEEQLTSLGEYVIENGLWADHQISFLDADLGFPNDGEDLSRNSCGVGKTFAIDVDGNLFPCIRFLQFTLKNRTYQPIGDIYKGIDPDRLKPFLHLSRKAISDAKCLTCEVASGCASCAGYNYDQAGFPTLYQRNTSLCNMHKARVRANLAFWGKFAQVTGKTSPWEIRRKHRENLRRAKRFLYIIYHKNFLAHCQYVNDGSLSQDMAGSVLTQSLEFARSQVFTPVLLIDTGMLVGFDAIDEFLNNGCEPTVVVRSLRAGDKLEDNCIIKISRFGLEHLAQTMMKCDWSRINLAIEDASDWEIKDVKIYKKQLCELADLLLVEERPREVNVLSDKAFGREVECGAGVASAAVDPTGKIFPCPAFSLHRPMESIGDIWAGVNPKLQSLFDRDHSPVCSRCTKDACLRCVFSASMTTGEFKIPSDVQCLITKAECEACLPERR